MRGAETPPRFADGNKPARDTESYERRRPPDADGQVAPAPDAGSGTPRQEEPRRMTGRRAAVVGRFLRHGWRADAGPTTPPLAGPAMLSDRGRRPSGRRKTDKATKLEEATRGHHMLTRPAKAAQSEKPQGRVTGSNEGDNACPSGSAQRRSGIRFGSWQSRTKRDAASKR